MTALAPMRAWLRQTSTIGGIATLAAAGIAYLTRALGLDAAVSMGVGAVVAIALPGHPDVSAQVTKVATEAAIEAVQGHQKEAVQALAAGLVDALKKGRAA